MNRSEQKKHGYDYRREDLMNAIAAVRVGDEMQFVKYHNIKKSNKGIENFEKMLKDKFKNVLHVNYDGGVSRKFLFRNTIEN
jgi:hypothetical protein